MPIGAVGSAIIWFAVFLGGFVFIEPAPYELYLVLVIGGWLLFNPVLPRAIGPLVILLILFMVGGVIAAMQAEHWQTQPIYYAVTGFLALSSCFFAAILGTNERLFSVVVSGWIAAALATVALGMLGYFGLTGELFTKFGRAAGGFQDPNVFGPFLAFPFVMLVRRAMTRPLGSAVWDGALALFLLVGIFLSFSRAAWGLTFLTAAICVTLLFLTEQRSAKRARILGMAALGVVGVVVVIAAVLSLGDTDSLFAERAQVVQDYDGGHLGRFQRHAIGFNMMVGKPLGIGALEFGKIFGEDEHDIWLKSLTTYGWLGFASYLTLTIWTLVAAFPLLFRTSSLQPIVQVAYIVFLGHIIVGTVIDIDHWRHVFLLLGMLWGAIAADRLRRGSNSDGAAPSVAPPYEPHYSPRRSGA
jgi:hypothetical protein